MKSLDALRKNMASILDISEHLGLLRGIAMDPFVKTIVELGFRTGVSTLAFISTGKQVHSFDIKKCQPARSKLEKIAKEDWSPTNFRFQQADTLKLQPFDCDLLFIDTLHTYEQLKHELLTWGPHVSQKIVCHDTETFGKVGEDNKKPGLRAAIDLFLATNKEWRLLLHLTNNNGLTILERSTTL